MRLIWPEPGRDLDDDALTELYRPEPNLPAVRVGMVSSVDGAVTVDGTSGGLGTPADKRVFALLRMYPDALLVGAGTVRAEGYRAVRLDQRRRDWRDAHGLPRYPRLVIVSGRLDLPADHPALADAPVRPAILTHANAPADRRAALAEVADVLVHGDRHVDLAAGLAELRGAGLERVLCEGGPVLFGALLAADLVDELCVTISPMLVGAGPGRIIAGPGSTPHGMRLAHALADGDTLLLRYAR